MSDYYQKDRQKELFVKPKQRSIIYPIITLWYW